VAEGIPIFTSLKLFVNLHCLLSGGSKWIEDRQQPAALSSGMSWSGRIEPKAPGSALLRIAEIFPEDLLHASETVCDAQP